MAGLSLNSAIIILFSIATNHEDVPKKNFNCLLKVLNIKKTWSSGKSFSLCQSVFFLVGGGRGWAVIKNFWQ